MRLRLLILGRDDASGRRLGRQLEGLGRDIEVEVQVVEGVAGDLDRREVQSADLVLLESSSGAPGPERILAELLDRYPEAPVVVVGGSDQEQTFHRALEVGALDCVAGSELTTPAGRRSLLRALALARRLRRARRTDEALRDLVDNSIDLMCTHDLEGRLLSVNRTLVEAYGAGGRDELVGRSLAEFLIPEARPLLAEYLEEIRGRGRASGHMKVYSRSGQERILEYHNWLQREGVDGPVVRGTARDVTELRQAEAHLRRSEGLLRLFVKHAPAAVAMFDREMRYLVVSDRWRADYQLEGVELLGRSHFEVLPEMAEHWREIYRRCLAGEMEQSDEDPMLRPDGGLEWVRWEMRPWNAPSGEVGGVLMLTEIITDRKRVEDALRYLATHDHLTGLLNRASFLDRLERSCERATRNRHYGFALLFLDLDGFKEVNDALGHAVGDELLQQVAARLRDELRPKDAVARFAGDEFVMLLEDVSRRDEAAAATRRLLARLTEPIVLLGQTVAISGSIGIALAEEGITADDLLKRADSAMYAAKQSERGGWVVASSAN